MGLRSGKLESVGKSLILFTIVFFVFIFNVRSQTSILDKTEKKTYKKAVKLLNQGKTDDALTLFLEVYASNPTNIDNLYQITGIYYDELEDYGNAYKYGKQLLEIAKEALPTIDNNKEKVKIKDIIDEIQLLVEIAKDKLGPHVDEVNDNTIQSNFTEKKEKSLEKDISTVGSEELSGSEPDNEKNKQEQEAIITIQDTIEMSTTDNDLSEMSQDIETDVFEGFIPYGRFNSGNYQYIKNVFDSIKNKKLLQQNGFSKLYSKNKKINELFSNDFVDYLNTIQETEKQLVGLIYNYNINQYEKDSSEKRLSYLNQRNSILIEKIASIDTMISNLNFVNDSNILNKIQFEPSVYIAKYLIKESVDNKKILQLLSSICSLVKQKNEFENPVVNEFLTFITSDNENKYLIIAVQVKESLYNKNNNESGFIELNDLEVYDLFGDSLFDIGNNRTISLSDFRLRSNELKTLNSFINAGKQERLHTSVPKSQFSDSLRKMQNKLLSLRKELDYNNFIINSSKENYDSITEKYLFEFNNVLNNYNALIKGLKVYGNRLEVRKEIETKTSLEQFKDMAKIITDLINKNLENVEYNMSIIKSVMDTVDSVPQISTYTENLKLMPELDKVKILSISKIKEPVLGDNYLALNLGYELSFSDLNEGLANVSAGTKVNSNNVEKPGASKQRSNENIVSTPSSKTADDRTVIENSKGGFLILNEQGTLLIKDDTGKKWKMLEDNPGSFISYTMFNEEKGWRLPTYQELKSLLNYLSSNPDVMNSLGWPNNGEVYLSSDSHLDNRNNTLLKGIKVSGSSLKETEVQSGGEVWIVLISE